MDVNTQLSPDTEPTPPAVTTDSGGIPTVTAPSLDYSAANWNDLITKHNGIIGQTITNPTIRDANGRRVTNPNPTIRYVFADGYTVTARQTIGADGVATDGMSIVNPGTALAPSKRASGPTTRLVNGTLYQYDPTANTWKPADGVPGGTPKQVPGRTVKGDDGTIYTVGADGATLTEAEAGQNLGKQKADATTSNAATAAARAAATASNNTAKNGIAQQNADTNALKASYQQQIDQAKQDYLDGKLSLAEFQAQATELHQQATEALTARAQDLSAATTMARDQASADATWASTSVPAGGNQALVDVLNREGAPVGITLPKAQPTPYPRPSIDSMVANSLAKLGIAAPWTGSAGGAPPTVTATPATSVAAPAVSTPTTGFQVPTPATAAPTQGVTVASPGMPAVTPGPRFGVTGPQ